MVHTVLLIDRSLSPNSNPVPRLDRGTRDFVSRACRMLLPNRAAAIPSLAMICILAGLGNTAIAQTITPNGIGFGNVAVNNTSRPHPVTVRNNLATSIGITPPTITGDFVVASTTCGANLTSGGSCVYELTFTPLATGAVSGTFTANVTGGTALAPVTLTGTGTAPTALNSTTVNFGYEAVGNTSPIFKSTLYNYQSTPLSISAQYPTGEFQVVADGCGSSLAAFSSCSYQLTFTPSALGPQPTVPGSVTLTINTNASNSPLVATMVGEGEPPVAFVPSSVNFGDEAVNNSSNVRTVTLHNYQSTTITLTQPILSGEFSISGGTCISLIKLAANSSCTFGVVFTPTTTSGNPQTSVLSILTSASGSPVTATLTGTGTGPTGVSATSLNFGNQVLNTQSASKTVRLYNYQATALSLTPPTLSGEFALGTGTCATVLAPNSSCTYLVTFTPSELGTQQSVLNLVFNASTSPTSISLTGVGITPVSATPTSINFGNSHTGVATAAKTVTVKNFQSVPLNLQAPTTTGDYAVTGGTCNTETPLVTNATCTYLVTFTPEQAGTRTGSLSVNDSANNSPQTVALTGVGTNSPASIQSVAPGAGQRGTTVPVTIAGLYTHFQSANPGVTPTVSFGTGITVSNISVIDDTHLTASLAIAASAVAGARTVTVTSGTEKATLAAGFVVSTASGLTFTNISPSSASQGQSLSVSLSASASHFVQGTTLADFGDGITVNSLAVTDSLDATASITISNTTPAGTRIVTLVTGGEFVTGTFLVTQSSATLLSVTPSTAEQGSNLTLTILGANTHFLSGASTVSLGSGINIGNITVLSPVSLQVAVAVTPTATAGAHSVTVTTGGETVTLPSSFTVTGSTPYLSTVSPSSGQQGTSLNVTFTGQYTTFQQATTSVTFGSNITGTRLRSIHKPA